MKTMNQPATVSTPEDPNLFELGQIYFNLSLLRSDTEYLRARVVEMQELISKTQERVKTVQKSFLGG